MATVTGMTAAAMQAIRDGTIVSAAFDSANHLILTKYDGTQVDGGVVGAATTAQSGLVELATNAETQSGSDATRAVTPAGLASLPGYRVQIVTGLKETDSPSAWPYGTSMQACTSGDGGGWTPHGGDGTVVTESISLTRTAQIFYENSGGTASTKAWMREYNSGVGGGGWTAWAQIMLAVRLNEANFTQNTSLVSYPSGKSYLYYTTSNGGSWDFSGMQGVVETMFLTDKAYGSQIFTQHVSGSQNTPEVWFRTSDTSVGWSSWRKQNFTPGAWNSYTPTWGTTSGLNTPSLGNATVSCKYFKVGRMVTVRFEITFGSTTNFGGGTGTDNWTFGLPVPAARSTDTMGWLEFYDTSASAFSWARVKGATTTAFSLGSGVAAAGSTNTDVDSGGTQPWAWGSGDQIRGTFVYESAA